MMTMRLGAITMAATLALAGMTGCATRAQTGMLIGGIAGGFAGAAIGAGTGSVLASVAGVGIGALIGGEIGRHFDKYDNEMVSKSIETNSTQTWTTARGTSASASCTGDDERKDLTVTEGDKTEKSTIVKKHGHWIKE